MCSEQLFTQYQKLAIFGSGRTLQYVRIGFAASALGFLVIGIYFSEPWAYILAVFFGIVGISVWEQTKFWEAAVRAAEAGIAHSAIVTISMSCWSDSIHYHASVCEDGGDAWKFEFMPIGWIPAEGVFQAQVYSLTSRPWPVLLETDSGLIFPRYKPVKVRNGGLP